MDLLVGVRLQNLREELGVSERRAQNPEKIERLAAIIERSLQEAQYERKR